MKVLILCVMAVVWIQMPSGGDAVCCHTHKYRDQHGIGHRCNDCYLSMQYCGVGSCNLFGCNCDNGCRKGKCSKDNYARLPIRRSLDAHDVIRAADENGDGRMSLAEAHAHLAPAVRSVRSVDAHDVIRAAGERMSKMAAAEDVKRSLEELDVDNDQFLTAEEIDS